MRGLDDYRYVFQAPFAEYFRRHRRDFIARFGRYVLDAHDNDGRFCFHGRNVVGVPEHDVYTTLII